VLRPLDRWSAFLAASSVASIITVASALPGNGSTLNDLSDGRGMTRPFDSDSTLSSRVGK